MQTVAQPNNMPGGDRRDMVVHGQNVNYKPRPILDTLTCLDLEFQTLDGTCNNISRGSRMDLGASDIKFKRDLPARYGSSDLLNTIGGENRISARAVSNLVVDQPSIIFSEFNLSALVYNWGQFLDHDITLAPESELESEPILLPEDEPLFTEDLSFHRSEYYETSGDSLPREQINILTSWIDGTNIYGAEAERADWLRSFEDGKLKVSEGNLLPFNTIDGEYDSEVDTLAPTTGLDFGSTKGWVAGDFRAGEQVGLTTLHTLFVREHNRICDELIATGMTNDEEIFLNARKKIIALLQKITYQEFLPALGLDIADYEGYNSEVDPDITATFASAAYRIGHTMVVDSVRLFDNDCNNIDVVSLAEAFFNSEVIRTNGIEPFIKGLTIETQYEIDPYIVDELRDFLFTASTAPLVAGMDLASLNIQRARDHGIPDYNSLRNYYTGSSVTSFNEISSNATIVATLESAFASVDDIDAWAGLISEDRVEGTSLGITMHAILGDQFERLRDGDRFYYEREGNFTSEELEEINNTSQSDIIMRNTDLVELAADIMYAQNCVVSSTAYLNPSSDMVKIVPNPSRDQFNISAEGDLKIQRFFVFDNAGKKVLSNENDTVKFDMSTYSPGVYFVQLLTSEGVIVKKITLIK